MFYYLNEIIITIRPNSFSVQKRFTGGRVEKKDYPLTDKKIDKVLSELKKDFSSSSSDLLIIVNHQSEKSYFQSFPDFETFMKAII